MEKEKEPIDASKVKTSSKLQLTHKPILIVKVINYLGRQFRAQSGFDIIKY